jgi:hypothetical protein
VEKEKIVKEVEEIINNFMEKLKVIENEIKELKPEDFYLIERDNLRKEEDKEEKEWKNFKEKWFKVAPQIDGDYLLTEKAKWKK